MTAFIHVFHGSIALVVGLILGLALGVCAVVQRAQASLRQPTTHPKQPQQARSFEELAHEHSWTDLPFRFSDLPLSIDHADIDRWPGGHPGHEVPRYDVRLHGVASDPGMAYDEEY